MAITIFMGVPMTLALVIGLVFYCTYECLKYAFSAKSYGRPAAVSDERVFTRSLSQLAGVHGPSQEVTHALRAESSQAVRESAPAVTHADNKV